VSFGVMGGGGWVDPNTPDADGAGVGADGAGVGAVAVAGVGATVVDAATGVPAAAATVVVTNGDIGSECGFDDGNAGEGAGVAPIVTAFNDDDDDLTHVGGLFVSLSALETMTTGAGTGGGLRTYAKLIRISSSSHIGCFCAACASSGLANVTHAIDVG